MERTIMVSNRVATADQAAQAGGVAFALTEVRRHYPGPWIGWSGTITDTTDDLVLTDQGDSIFTTPLLAEELDPSRSRLEPGVQELLDHLAQDQRFHLGVLTGNLEVTARLKLDLFELNPTFPVGAFGSDCADRQPGSSVASSRCSMRGAQKVGRCTPLVTWPIGT